MPMTALALQQYCGSTALSDTRQDAPSVVQLCVPQACCPRGTFSFSSATAASAGTRSWARSTSRRRRKGAVGRRCIEWISPRGCAMASSWTASWLEGLSQVTCCACWRSGRMSTVRPTARHCAVATRLTVASFGTRGDSGALFAGLDFGERAGRQRAAGAGGGRGAHWAGERLHELCGVAGVGHDGQPFAQSRRLLHAPSVEGAVCVRVVTTDAILGWKRSGACVTSIDNQPLSRERMIARLSRLAMPARPRSTRGRASSSSRLPPRRRLLSAL